MPSKEAMMSMVRCGCDKWVNLDTNSEDIVWVDDEPVCIECFVAEYGEEALEEAYG